MLNPLADSFARRDVLSSTQTMLHGQVTVSTLVAQLWHIKNRILLIKYSDSDSRRIKFAIRKNHACYNLAVAVHSIEHGLSGFGGRLAKLKTEYRGLNL